MAFRLGKGFVEFLLHDARFVKGLQRVKAALIKMRQALRTAARYAKYGLLVIGGMFAYLVKSASDAQEIISKFKAVFKEQTAAAEEFADALSRAIGRSKIAIREYMASMQDTFVPLGFARKQARLLSQRIVKLGIDMASFSNKVDADAIRDLQSALVGNHETVRKYGIIITETSLKQEMMNMGLRVGYKDASAQQKVLARLNIIFAGTADAQGDAVRTAREFANTYKRFKGQVRDLASALGTQLLPVVSEWLVKVIDLTGHLQSLGKKQIQGLIKGAKTLGKVLIAIWLAPALISAVTSFVRLIGGVGHALRSVTALGALAANSLAAAFVGAAALIVVAWARAKREIMTLQLWALRFATRQRAIVRLVKEERKAREDLKKAESPAERLEALTRQKAALESLIDVHERAAEQAKEEFKTARDEEAKYGRLIPPGIAGEITRRARERAVLERERAEGELRNAQQMARFRQQQLDNLEAQLKLTKVRAKVDEESRAAEGAAELRKMFQATTQPAAQAAARERRKLEFVGLQEMFRRLATAGEGAPERVQKDQLQVAKRQLTAQERILAKVDEIMADPRHPSRRMPGIVYTP